MPKLFPFLCGAYHVALCSFVMGTHFGVWVFVPKLCDVWRMKFRTGFLPKKLGHSGTDGDVCVRARRCSNPHEVAEQRGGEGASLWPETDSGYD